MEQALFYILATVAVVGTLFCITEKHPVHAIVYLVTSFFSLAMIFYLLQAPLVAVFEVIIYAGAIMVLFLFIIMMLQREQPDESMRPGLKEWWPAVVLGGVLLISVATIAIRPSAAPTGMAVSGIREFAKVLFKNYGIAVEIISFQLLFALVGALYLGRRTK